MRCMKYRHEVLAGEVGLRVRELVGQTCEYLEIEVLRSCFKNLSLLKSGTGVNIFGREGIFA